MEEGRAPKLELEEIPKKNKLLCHIICYTMSSVLIVIILWLAFFCYPFLV